MFIDDEDMILVHGEEPPLENWIQITVLKFLITHMYHLIEEKDSNMDHGFFLHEIETGDFKAVSSRYIKELKEYIKEYGGKKVAKIITDLLKENDISLDTVLAQFLNERENNGKL
jgi:hypothetical protein